MTWCYPSKDPLPEKGVPVVALFRDGHAHVVELGCPMGWLPEAAGPAKYEVSWRHKGGGWSELGEVVCWTEMPK